MYGILFECRSFYKNRMVEPSSESKQLHEEKEKRKDNENSKADYL